ncbi:MAG: hypothetical protein HKN00_02520 [Flavobacteriaceae bacterium]|nr:hypothetical protein [Flavobacteriaceae bacterium]
MKILLIIGFISISNAVVYGQEEMQDAIISLEFSEENDSKTIIATAEDQDRLPIEDLELYFFVKRTFSLLPIGDAFNATNEDGVIEVEFPNDLNGDVNGDVVIVVKIIESDIYNDLTIEKTKNWGTPIVIEDPKDEKRSLWAAAANAPMSLIFIVSALILSVWYIICYIFYKLYKISKIKPMYN